MNFIKQIRDEITAISKEENLDISKAFIIYGDIEKRYTLCSESMVQRYMRQAIFNVGN